MEKDSKAFLQLFLILKIKVKMLELDQKILGVLHNIFTNFIGLDLLFRNILVNFMEIYSLKGH
jgi:hypothetical protein